MKPARWDSAEWADNNLLLEARAGGSCERCGKQCGPVERHHRKRRREGGDNLNNLLFLGRPCHAQVHAHPVESRRYGFIVSAYADPAVVPVLYRRREWIVLGDDGSLMPLPEPDLSDAHDVNGPVTSEK